MPATSALADALGRVFGSAPGHTWVRVRALDASCYAENGTVVSTGELPVFVTVQHAAPPTGAELQAEVAAITQTVAACVAREPELVHVSYAAAGAGRQAFGGRLV